MSKQIKKYSALPAPGPRTHDSQVIAYAYAGALVVMVLCQLFTFDEYIPLLESFNLWGGNAAANLIGGVIVVFEVLALPFLLRLNLSHLMRVICMLISLAIPIIWFKLSLWLLLTNNSVSNAGFLGTLVEITPGWWMVYACIALGILAIWAAWGLWPLHHKE